MSSSPTSSELVLTNPDEQGIVVEARAQSFLYHQVRNMVGFLKFVGEGKLDPSDTMPLLELKDRAAAPPMAPPDGLYLERIYY